MSRPETNNTIAHDLGEKWEECEDHPCPACNEGNLWSIPWWDDPPELGGSCIGTLFECGCGHTDSF